MRNPISERYKVGLTMTTNGRTAFLKDAAYSLNEMVLNHWHFDFRCVIDDSGSHNAFKVTKEYLPGFNYIRNTQNLGLAQSVATVWNSVPADIDFIFHVEDDFIYNNIPRLDNMVSIVAKDKNLWQMLLKRQPVNPVEEAVGGFINQNPNAYYPNADINMNEVWLEHQEFFSLNPCIIPSDVFRGYGWPVGNEAEMKEIMTHNGGWSSIMGGKVSLPEIHHIGTHRSENWKL